MSKFYNNVKSRLNKKGIKGLTKTDYLLAAEHLGISDLDNATTEQIVAGVDYLMGNQSTELVSIESIVSDLPNKKHQDTDEIVSDADGMQAIAPLEEDINVGAIALLEEDNKSSELSLSDTDELILEAIESAPSDIKQNLLIQYAEREFQSASELIAFKHQIDCQIDEFTSNELQKTATDRNDKWERLQQKITTNADKNLVERKQSQANFLGNLQARIAEFSISKKEN